VFQLLPAAAKILQGVLVVCLALALADSAWTDAVTPRHRSLRGAGIEPDSPSGDPLHDGGFALAFLVRQPSPLLVQVWTSLPLPAFAADGAGIPHVIAPALGRAPPTR
jgi:hypothetical protein